MFADLLADTLNAGTAQHLSPRLFVDCHFRCTAGRPFRAALRVGETEFRQRRGGDDCQRSLLQTPCSACAAIVIQCRTWAGAHSRRGVSTPRSRRGTGPLRFGIRYQKPTGPRQVTPRHPSDPHQPDTRLMADKTGRAGFASSPSAVLTFDVWTYHPPARRGRRPVPVLSRLLDRARSCRRPLG